MALIKKFITVFVAASLTLYALWLGVLFWSYEDIPTNLYGDPLPIFAILALATALISCIFPLRKKSSHIVFGCLFSATVAGVLSVVYGH